jgi:Family of unknown function (DUF5519)
MTAGRRVVVAAVAVMATSWAVKDYLCWRALGAGGLPHTLRGWLTVVVLRIEAWHVDRFDTTGWAGTGHLSGSLAVRPGPRPTVAPYPIPHRQIDQHPDPQFTPNLTIASFVASRPGLTCSRSYFEKHTDAAFAAPGCAIHADGEVSGGEIAHVHGDGSLHVVLARADAAQAIDRGWGELHPLAGRTAGLPATYVLLYSPRTPGEVAVVERLLNAAAAHMTADVTAMSP